MPLKLLFAALLTVFVAACDQTPVTSAERVTTQEAVGTIRDVDRVNRRVVLRIDGRSLTLRANEAVPAFDIVEVGDRVRVTYTEALAVDMANPDDDGAVRSAASSSLFAGDGQVGRAAGGVISAVVEHVSFDPATNRATLIGPEGNLLVVNVDRELRAFARSRAPGDRIVVTYAIGTAIALELAPES